MITIEARNVNEALKKGIDLLVNHGIREESRNGTVLVAPAPVCTVYQNPRERVLFSPLRDANPFFHLMEALWMLAGHNDLEWPKRFNKRFGEYSDDGVTIHGAYGHRWRNWFGFDQLNEIIEELCRNPNTRRAVLTMWSPEGDLVPVELRAGAPATAGTGGLNSRDVPCNTHAYFDLRGGVLNMTVCNRSNDVIWGAYGANVVHFSILQEYLASMVGVPMGVYRQMSNNYHAYTDVYSVDKLLAIANECGGPDTYQLNPHMNCIPLIGTNIEREKFDKCLWEFLDEVSPEGNFFISHVAEPMLQAWQAHKNKDYPLALSILDAMPNCDWRYASLSWMNRRVVASA